MKRQSNVNPPEWSADVGRGMKLEISAIMDKFGDRPLTYVASLRTKSGTLYSAGELTIVDGRLHSRIKAADIQARGADLVAVVDAWDNMVEWASIKTVMDE